MEGVCNPGLCLCCSSVGLNDSWGGVLVLQQQWDNWILQTYIMILYMYIYRDYTYLFTNAHIMFYYCLDEVGNCMPRPRCCQSCKQWTLWRFQTLSIRTIAAQGWFRNMVSYKWRLKTSKHRIDRLYRGSSETILPPKQIAKHSRENNMIKVSEKSALHRKKARKVIRIQ